MKDKMNKNELEILKLICQKFLENQIIKANVEELYADLVIFNSLVGNYLNPNLNDYYAYTLITQQKFPVVGNMYFVDNFSIAEDMQKIIDEIIL